MTDAYGGVGGSAIAEYAIAEAGGGAPSLLDLLQSGDYATVVVQEMRSAGSSLVYRMYLSDRVWTTLPTDTLPSMTLGGEIDAGPLVKSTVSFGPGAQNNGEQSGSIDLIISPDGVPVETVGYGVTYQGLTRIRREKVVGGWSTKIMVGDPAYGLDSFTTVWQGVGEDLTADGVTKATLTYRDNRAALSRGVLTPFAGTGGAEGTAEMAGKLKPRHYGAPKNVSPVLIDPTLNIYCVSDMAASVALPAAYDGAKALTVDSASLTTYAALASHSVASGSWAQARVSGVGTFVKLRAAPTKRLTVDFADVQTVPAIIRAVLEAAGVASGSIIIETEGYPFGSGTDHSAKWQEVQGVIQDDAAGYCYISDQATPNDIVDSLCKGIGWSRYLDAFGNERFTSPDYTLGDGAVPEVDFTVLSTGDAETVTNSDGSSYLAFAGGDILTMRELDLPGSMWPPNGRERLMANKNHTLMSENDVLSGASDAMRQYVQKAGDEATVESPSDIFAALKTAVDPEALDTHIVDKAYLTTLGEWLLITSSLSDGRGAPDLFLTKRQIFEVVLPMAFFAKLQPFGVVKFHHPTFYGDAGVDVIGQSMPVEWNWEARTITLYVYGQAQQYSSLWVAETQGSAPGTSLAGASGSAQVGDVAYVSCSTRASVAVLDMSTPSAPAWVTEVRGPSPGTSLSGAADVLVSGGYAFVPCVARASLAIMDASTPSSPSWLAEIQGPVPGTSLLLAKKVVKIGSYAYVLRDLANPGIAVINVSAPASPTWVTQITEATLGISTFYPTCMAAYGSHLIVGDDNGLLRVIDVSTPSSPTLTGSSPAGSAYEPMAVAIYGSSAFVSCGNGNSGATPGNITTFDLSTLSAPALVKVTPLSVGGVPVVTIGDAIVEGFYLYTRSYDAPALFVLDVSTPSSPTVVATVTGPDPSLSLFGTGYLSYGGAGVLCPTDINSVAVVA
ncbi:LVIVD repeat-containing protein [Azospirillum himalayense]|uniref:LVIVD repeat-containing protein n=1 Tax=Azospirillum himalayense TaxID=654847 RepID=A0ABW0FXN5_9PROT